MVHLPHTFLFFLLVFHYQPPLEGKWTLYRSESFENILTSENFQLQDEKSKEAITNAFNTVIEGYFYDFRKDTVVFTNYTNFEIVELKGLWWTEGDTLIIGRTDKISVQKYYISHLNEKELHLQLIVPKWGGTSESRWMFKKK